MLLEVPHFLERVKKMGKERYIEHLEYKYNIDMRDTERQRMEDTVTENTRITPVGGKKKSHLYTWERIYHFSCGNCKNWWSYATSEDSYTWKSRNMTCPHCAYYTKIEPNPNIMEK